MRGDRAGGRLRTGLSGPGSDLGSVRGDGMRLSAISHLGVFGLLLLILGFQTFTFTLLFQIVHRGHEGARP